MMSRHLVVCLLAACTSNPPAGQDPTFPPDPIDPTNPPMRDHDPRFHGWWIVEQPNHALYEATYYDLRPDGTVGLGPSVPPDCGGHLGRHCVTGSVANCVPPASAGRCQSELTCVFGNEWFSTSSRHLVIVGTCSDGHPREIVIEMNADPSSNTSWGGAGGRLLSVGGELDWSHDNWEWAFRKCPAGTDPSTCEAL
jgi:hypothetical protein